MTKTRKVFLGVFAAIFVFALAFFFTACTTEYTLTFMDGETEIAKVVGAEGTSVEVPEEASKEGYELIGWYLNSDLSGDEVEIPSTIPAQNVTYYAKYAALRTITLETDGGNYDNITVQLAEGTNLLDSLSKKVSDPTKPYLVFGAWFIDDEEVTSETLVPESDVTLTAKYKVEYTVEYYLESDEEDGTYVIDDSKTETGIDWEGTYYSPTVFVNGYELVENENSVESLTLSATDKTFKFYFDKSYYTLSYSANVPSGASSTGTMAGESATYQSVITIDDCGYSIEGYRFLGWATTATATSAQYAAGDSYTVTGNVILYAVWDRGYSNRNGGSDYVFITGEGTIIFVRAGVEFEGTYATVDGLTQFTVNIGAATTYTGSLADDYTFALYNEAQDGTYTYAANNGETTTVATLELDGFYNAVYTVVSGEEEVEYEGTYSLVSTNTYYFSSTSGGFYFRLGTDSEDNDVFYVMGNEGYYGYIYLTYLYSLYATSGSYSFSTIGYSYSYYVYCDGFGTGVISDSSNSVSGEYSYSTEIVTLIDGDATLEITFYDGDTEIYRIIIIPLSSFYAYLVYDEDFDKTFEISSGVTLELDGYAYNAIYTNGDTVLSGKYSCDESILGGYYINFVDEDGANAYKFYLDESGQITVCEGEEAGAYRYLEGLYYKSDYVLYLDGNGNATIYDASGTTLVTIAYGTYTKNGDEYTFTLDATKDTAEGYTVYSEIVFTLYSDDIYEMVSSTVKDGDKTTYFVTYTASNGDTLEWHGNGLFTYNGKYSGLNTSSDTGWYYGYYYDSDALSYVYIYFNLEVDENGNNILVLLDLMPRINTYYSQYGLTDSAITLYLDGLGNAVYIKDGVEVNGAYTVTSESEGIYSFVSEDGAIDFDFLLLISSSSSSYSYYFAVYDEVYNGTLTGSDGSTLVIDGFGFTATYTTANGAVYEGYYYFYDEENDTIIFSSSDLDYTVYFYLEDESTYVVYDQYAGLYYSVSADGAIDSQYLIYLDGDGTALLYYYSTYMYYYYYYANYYYFYYNGYSSYASYYAQYYAQYGYLVTSSSTYLYYGRYYAINYAYAAIGTYVELDSDAETLQITLTEGVEAALTEFPDPFTIKLISGLYSTFYIYDSEYDISFIGTNGSVLALDGVGNAVYSTADGEKISGDYKLVQSSDGTEVIIVGSYAFAVDYENKTFELYATLLYSYYDYYYYYYGYGDTVLTVWEMTDGTQTISLDLTDSYYAYAGGFEYLLDVDGNEFTLWFIPFITYSSGYYVYVEYIYEYVYTYTDSNSEEQTMTIHYDGLISLYYGYIVMGSQYDVSYIVEVELDNYTVIEYIYLFGSYDDYSGEYLGYFYSFAIADENGDLLNYNYYYYNYLYGYVYDYVDSGVYLYFVSGDIVYDEIYLVTFGNTLTTVTVIKLEKQTLIDNENKYTLYYVEYDGTLYALYLTKEDSTLSIYNEVVINDDGTYRVFISYDGSYDYLLLDETGATRALYLCETVTTIANGDYTISFALVCDGKLYYVESFYNGSYSILGSGTLGDEIVENNGTYTIEFETEAAKYVATITYDETDGWTLSVVAETIVYTVTEGDVEVVFSLDESGEVVVSSVTIAGENVTSYYDSENYELTYNGTIANGTVISVTFTTQTLSYTTRYIVSYNSSEIGYYDYTSEGTVEDFQASEGYAVISASYDETYLTVVASYVYSSETYYSTCVITLGTNEVTVSNLTEKTVSFTTSDDYAVSVVLLVDSSDKVIELLSMTYDGSSVTGTLYETSDGKYAVVYYYYAYVITLGETDNVEEYSISIYYSSGSLVRSGLYLVKFGSSYDSDTTVLTVNITGFYVYENGEYVLKTLPDSENIEVETNANYCTVAFTSDNVYYEIVFYYSQSGKVYPEVYATKNLVSDNNTNVTFTYVEYVSSGYLTVSPDSLTIGSVNYSYSSHTLILSYVYLMTFISDADSETLVYILLDMSGTDMVCYFVQYDTVTSGSYRFVIYYYVSGDDIVVVAVDTFYVNESDVWTKTSATFEETDVVNTYSFTYGGTKYTVTFGYSESVLTATVTEVVESDE